MRGGPGRSLRVTRLPQDPGQAGWNALLPAAPPPVRLEEDVTAEYLVIGAGFAGLSAARRLAEHRPGARIVVLDASRVGAGPAGRNSGFMIDLPHDLSSADYGGALDADAVQTRGNRAGIDFAASMAAEFGLGDEAFARSGKVNAAASDKGSQHNRNYAAHLAALGEPHQMMDAAQMAQLTGTDYYNGGLFTPGTAIIQPAIYVRGVADGLRGLGVSIRENSPVLTLDGHSKGWVARTPHGSVTAPQVILAVNGHANSFGLFPGRLLHVFTYASMTRALGVDEIAKLGGQPRWGITPADPMGTTVRRVSGTGGTRIIVRNRFTCDPEMMVSDRRITRIGRNHDRAFLARFPALAGTSMEFRWGGRLCLSKNNVAAFGEVADGVYSACCQNGLGTAKGTLNGMLAADLACGHASENLDHALNAAAPSRLPPRPFSTIGANAVMRWGEFRAGREM